MRLTIVLLALLAACPAAAQPIEVFFTHVVDSALASPKDNLARGGVDFSTVVAREVAAASYSVDMAMYNLSVSRVVDALIAAHRRGIRVRVIAHRENVDNPASRFSQLAANGIPVLASPVGAQGQPTPLMHNKFFIIDGRTGAGEQAHPVIITGSWNATVAQTYADRNNLVLLRDSAVAGAYLAEFEEMWGSSADQPDAGRARFGSAKSNNTDHTFTLADGTRVDLYFSPTDGTDSRIRDALATAQTSAYTANLTFTSRSLAQQLSLQKSRFGADVRSIVDNVSDSGSQFTFLQTFADAHAWPGDELLHHKYAVVDAVPIESGSFPLVVTGSHNWTYSANSINDENTLIIYSQRIANQFLQEFAARYREAGGERAFVPPSFIIMPSSAVPQIRPVPFDDLLVVNEMEGGGEVQLMDILGNMVVSATVPSGVNEVRLRIPPIATGLYLLRIVARTGARTYSLPRR